MHELISTEERIARLEVIWLVDGKVTMNVQPDLTSSPRKENAGRLIACQWNGYLPQDVNSPFVGEDFM